MGLTSAMYTGLTGLSVNSTRVETIGNNIANVNTTAFKGSRTLFQTLFSQTMTMGTAPSASTGGTNPMQVGEGAGIATTQRTSLGGAPETTGLPSDVAIDGSGYFIVHSAAGREFYTRDGAFTLNAQNQLVTADGNYVQGFGVDQNFTVIPGTLTGLTIPLGETTVANATGNVQLDGMLSAAELPATLGSEHVSQAFADGGGAAATADTLLTDLRTTALPDTLLFAGGDVITVSGVSKGERALPPKQFTVGTDGSTLGEFAAWLQDAYGIQVGADVPGNPGITVENGQLVIRGNAGEPNALSLSGSDFVSTNAATALPFEFAQIASASGGGVFTSFTVYDSLGTPVSVNATFTLDSTPDTGPVWRYYLESADNAGGPRALGTGTVSFDTNGNFVGATGNQFNLGRTGTGAASPLAFTLDLGNLNGLSTRASNVVLGEQDGYPPGTLATYSVGDDGVITGVFTNGLTQPLGQIALATFRNDIGLLAESDNLFSAGPNSGPTQVTTPGVLGTGMVQGGALEMSNVDLTREFIGLITSSTGFQAASRVITVSNDMLDQLLLAMR